jgi:acyl-CoA reductase-like NAD-dependent aldehyde dehydrogenase
MTQVQPAAKAAATFRVIIAEGTDCQSGDHIPATIDGVRNVTIKQPIGVVGIITPWNCEWNVVTVRSHSLGCEPGG